VHEPKNGVEGVTSLKTGLFRLILAVLAPACVVAAGEGILRWMGVESAAPLIRVADERGAHWTSNPAYGRSIFPQEAGPALPPLWVPERKEAGEIRIVVLGESAAEGFPLSEFNLARVLETVVAERNPALRVRAISLAMTGVNSHQIRRLGLAAARCLDPDVVVLYAGNNEAIGPHGPAAVLPGLRRCLPLIRLQGAVREGRLAQVLDRGLRRARAAQGKSGMWRGLDEFRGVEIAADDPRLASMYRHFEANVDDLVSALTRRGIRVAICTHGGEPERLAAAGFGTADGGRGAAGSGPLGDASLSHGRNVGAGGRAVGGLALVAPRLRPRPDPLPRRFRINGILRARGMAGPRIACGWWTWIAPCTKRIPAAATTGAGSTSTSI
jgi:lysophospholipase L1-like esterase